MNRRRLTLIEVLQPQSFNNTPERSRVTRTIVQPEIDTFEQMEAQANANTVAKSAPAERQPDSLAALVTQQLTQQLLVA
ncbi:MAG: hypothetical protein QMD17_01485 [Rhodocyclaceae bacterium]|jgi:hypothetical protein|nr:hypothetical protein [Rhodocyclaceae bacterium]